MTLRFKAFDAINAADLHALIEDQVREDRYIDYKAAPVGRRDQDKKEFLADVASFANSGGGHMVFGMEDQQGLASRLVGLPSDLDLDAETLRLENMIRDGIDPRVQGVRTRPVPLERGGSAIVISIPQSWSQPHMVTYQGWNRFWTRASAGKFELDVGQIRAAFIASEGLTARIRSFRTERLGRIVADETPVALLDGPRLVVHLVPLSATDPRFAADIQVFRRESLGISALGGPVGHHRFNFDGFLGYQTNSQNDKSEAYVQVFRDGSLEGVSADPYLLSGPGRAAWIPSTVFEHALVTTLPHWLDLQHRMLVEPPVILMVSLLNVKGYTLAVRSTRYVQAPEPIERDTLLVADVLIEDFQAEPGRLLRPVFDAVWNAAGLPQSLNYDDDGNWRPPN